MKRFLIGFVILLVCGVGYWLISPLFISRVVVDDTTLTAQQEALLARAQRSESNADKDVSTEKVGDTSFDESHRVDDTDGAVKEVAEIVAVGSFISVAHEGSGTATITSLEEGGERILTLKDLDVSNGPDLRVLLSKNTNVRKASELGEYIEIDKLKGNIGTQHYILPDGIDPQEYRSVIIYCKPFRVVFNVADLSGSGSLEKN